MLKRNKRKRVENANKNRSDVTFRVNDPVYYKSFKRSSKLDSKWIPYYRIIEQIAPLTYVIKSLFDQKLHKARARQIRLANVLDWNIPKAPGRGRACQYVVPPKDITSTNESNYDIAQIRRTKIITSIKHRPKCYVDITINWTIQTC
jgi:hypothetical protein